MADERITAALLAVTMLVVTMFVMTNLGTQGKDIGSSYSIMAIFAALVFILYYIQKINVLGISFERRSMIPALITGFVALAIWIGASLLVNNIGSLKWASIAFSMGVPFSITTTMSFLSLGWFTVAVFAPIIETLFKASIFAVLSRRLNYYLSALITALIFSSFHLYAYTRGDYYAVTSPFIAAAMFGIIATILSFNRKNWIAAVIFHAGVNLFVLWSRGGA
jgi:membrane protease YdiL (CAAX protease family)